MKKPEERITFEAAGRTLILLPSPDGGWRLVTPAQRPRGLGRVGLKPDDNKEWVRRLAWVERRSDGITLALAMIDRRRPPRRGRVW